VARRADDIDADDRARAELPGGTHRQGADDLAAGQPARSDLHRRVQGRHRSAGAQRGGGVAHVQQHGVAAANVGGHGAEGHWEAFDRGRDRPAQKCFEAIAARDAQAQALGEQAQRVDVDQRREVDLRGQALDLGSAVARGPQRTDDRRGAASDHQRRAQAFLLEHLQHAHVREAARRTAGEHQRHAVAGRLGERTKPRARPHGNGAAA
jgi:hypothetical protein